MTQASVGFQCPDCVKAGRAAVRQPTAPFGGRISGDARVVTFTLMSLNVLVFLAVVATGGANGTLFSHLALLPQTTIFGMPDGSTQLVEGVSGGAYWQLVTSMFTHAEVLHIGFNMLALFFLGPQLERLLGRARFLAVYLVGGLVGSAAVMALSGPHTATVGASGAIFALMGALLIVGIKAKADLTQLITWVAINVVFTFTVGGISWQGHLGGLVGGIAAAAVVVYAPRSRRTPVQVAGLTVIALIALAIAVVRAIALR